MDATGHPVHSSTQPSGDTAMAPAPSKIETHGPHGVHGATPHSMQPLQSSTAGTGPGNRPAAFDKMEALVREMQDTEAGVPVRSQKLFLTSIPSAFMGYDLIEWLMERLGVEESEALNLANQLCQYGYFFPVSDSKNLVVKDDSSLYRFQVPYYWPWQHRPPDNVEYAIYLAKRTLRNKQRHGLEEHELEALASLRKNLQAKWDVITMQAEEQVKLGKDRKKGDKIVGDSQERAYWRVYRPPPGLFSSLEPCPVPSRDRQGRARRRTVEDVRREVELLRNSLTRTRVKMSQAVEGLMQHAETYAEYDPLIVPTAPSNPWVTEDLTFWQLNSPIVDQATEKRIRRWGLSFGELVTDPTGVQEFTCYLRKEYSHENIRFWLAVNDLRRSGQQVILRKVQEIYEEFLAPGAPCEINIDGKTMEKVQQELKSPSRFTFDAAAEHVYTLLLKKDCYPRFIRSDHYKNLLATGIQPSHKKRFFGFGGGAAKKKSTTVAPNPSLLQQSSAGGGPVCSGGDRHSGGLGRRRGSDRSLTGSAHELAVSGVKFVPHSHSQSNLSDIPYRGDMPNQQASPFPVAAAAPPVPRRDPATMVSSCDEGDSERRVPTCDVCPWDSGPSPPPPKRTPLASTSEDVCPWEGQPPPVVAPPAASEHPKSRKNSTIDSGSSSSDVSLALVELVSDRMRKSCGLRQNTLDCDSKSSRKLSTSSFIDQHRRASMCIPSTTKNSLLAEIVSNPSSSAPLPSALSATSPQKLLEGPPSISPSNSDKDNISATDDSFGTNTKTLRKTPSLMKAASLNVAPLISVSSVCDDKVAFDVLLEAPQGGDADLCEREHVDRLSPDMMVAPHPSPAPAIAPLAEIETATEDLDEDFAESAPSVAKEEPSATGGTSDDEKLEAALPEAKEDVGDVAGSSDGGDHAHLDRKRNAVCPWEDDSNIVVPEATAIESGASIMLLQHKQHHSHD